MKRSILIFGAGINQLTLIEAANELGVISVVIDPNSDAPGKKIADWFYCIAGDDYEGTKKIAIKHNVNGIVTSQMENPLRLMACLADELGYIFNSPEVVKKSRNKYLMKTAFLANNIPCAKGKIFTPDEAILPESLNDLAFLLILKPSDSYSSRGVYKINNFEELNLFIAKARSFSSDNSVIVEEFIEGPEYSIESITYNGETTIVQYTEKIITPFPNTVEIGHIQPAEFSQEQKLQIDAIVKNAVRALGIDNSASHTELKLTTQGPKIIEIGARLGGDFIPSYLTLASTGVNMDKAAIKVALGEKPDLKHKHKKYSFIKYLELEAGKQVIEVKKYSAILNDSDVVFAHVFVKMGDVIPKITDSAKRPACVLVQADSRKQVYKIADKIEKMLKSQILLGGTL